MTDSPSRLRHRARSRVAALAFGLSLVSLVAWLLWPQPLLVETGPVTIGPFEQILREDGRLRVRDRYQMAAPVAGALGRLSLRVGDVVQAGQVLASIHPVVPALIDARSREVLARRVDAAAAASEAARAQEGRAQAGLAQARLEAQRTERLAESRFVAPAAVDQARAALRIQERTLEAAQAEALAASHALAEARAALAGGASTSRGTSPDGVRQVRAPVGGRVLRVLQESAAPVAAGQVLLEIGDTARLEAVIDLLSGDALRLQAGGRVDLHTGSGQPPLVGRVARIEPVAFTRLSALGIEEQRVNVVVAIDEDARPGSGAGDGFRVDAIFRVSRVDDVLMVPSGALVRAREGGWAVLRVADGRVRQVAIEVLDRNVDFARVGGPLAPGERLVLYPGANLRDGDRVRSRAAGDRH